LFFFNANIFIKTVKQNVKGIKADKKSPERDSQQDKDWFTAG
jgi:hypothetical protein